MGYSLPSSYLSVFSVVMVEAIKKRFPAVTSSKMTGRKLAGCISFFIPLEIGRTPHCPHPYLAIVCKFDFHENLYHESVISNGIHSPETIPHKPYSRYLTFNASGAIISIAEQHRSALALLGEIPMRKLLFATAAAIAITTILTGTVRANEQEAMESVVANVKMLADNVCPKVESPIDEVTCRLEFSKLPLAVR